MTHRVIEFSGLESGICRQQLRCPSWRDQPYGKSTRYHGLDHTSITRGASVGVIGQKRPTCIHLESSTYDWFGLPRVGRNGFDSR